jgi:glutathione S-transferase
MAFSGTAHTLVLKRRLPAKPARVFKAISRAEEMRHWMCPQDFFVESVTSDLRVGGRFRIEMHSPDDEVFIVGGVFRVIDPPRRLVFTWKWEPEHTMAGVETTVAIDLEADGDETLLTMTHTGLPNEEERSSHEWGWTGAYEKLRDLVTRES